MNRYDQRMKELDARIVRADVGVQPIHLAEEDLQHVEQELGHPLPEDYREFLRDYGCYSLYASFRCAEPFAGGEWGSISLFHGVAPRNSHPFLRDSAYDLLENYRSQQKYAPAELLPIGSDSGGEPTCIAIAGEHVGAVYFWDRLADFVAEDYTNIHLVAHSFDEFMRLLKTEAERRAEDPNF